MMYDIADVRQTHSWLQLQLVYGRWLAVDGGRIWKQRVEREQSDECRQQMEL